MTRMATQEERWDHDRDLRKHEPRPGDKDFPIRLEKPLTTAMDIVVLVKALSNYTEAASLIETYAGMVAASARADEALLRLAKIEGGSNA
jgi:hypothetical protein